jgi:predicted DNA-binding transcriptional regulator AlpA
MARQKPPATAADDILTSPTAAQIAGLERVYFARLIREGKGPKHQRVKAGSRTLVLIVRSDLDAWIATRKG